MNLTDVIVLCGVCLVGVVVLGWIIDKRLRQIDADIGARKTASTIRRVATSTPRIIPPWPESED